MTLYYDPLNRACKSQTGAVARGSEIQFTVYEREGGEEGFSADACTLVFWQDSGAVFSFPMKREESRFTATVRFHKIGLYFYYFSLGDRGCIGRGKLRRGEVTHHPESWQVTVFREDYETPTWLKGGVMYQIFPDRFCKVGDLAPKPYQSLRPDWGGQPSFRPNEFGKVLNRDFFGGNLEGIRSKLGYLEGLGVTVIYLNPIFEAYSNHRYDTGDYLRVDGLLGTAEDLEALTSEAKKRGIRIVLDGVFNHTGDDSRYFNKFGRYDSLGAYQSPDSPYADWYNFNHFPDSYDSWWGIETLPAVNEQSKSYQDFIFGEGGVLKTWLRRGISGWRLDVADELPDFFLKKLRRAVKEENPEALVLGEVWEDASNKISYGVRREYLQGDELDSVMDYPLKDGIVHYLLTGNTALLRETLAMLLDNYPKQSLDTLMNSLGTHDTPRILTVLGGKHCENKEEMAVTRLSEEQKVRAKRLLRMGAVLQFTLPGVPCIYYGDEAGMEGYMDPFCRGCFPWDNIDEQLLSFYKTLANIRTRRLGDVFADGKYREIFSEEACIVYAREKDEKRVYVYCNNSTQTYNVKFKGSFLELITGEAFENHLTIPPYSYGILARK